MFLRNTELPEISENIPKNSDIVVVTTAEEEFTIITDGRALILGNETYTFKGDISVPIDKTLYPFDMEGSIL